MEAAIRRKGDDLEAILALLRRYDLAIYDEAHAIRQLLLEKLQWKQTCHTDRPVGHPVSPRGLGRYTATWSTLAPPTSLPRKGG